MKLVTVLVLAALPFCCRAGSGCQFLEDLVEDAMNSSVSTDEFKKEVRPFYTSEAADNSVENFKNCFLQQSEETLANARLMMDHIYSSKHCEIY